MLMTLQQGGYSGPAGLLQTGCDINTHNQFNNSHNPFRCWVEYYPQGAIYIDEYPSVGDQIAVAVKALSPTSGVVSLKNLNTGKDFTSTMSAPKPSNTILGPNNIAEFALETTPTPTIPAYSPAVTFTNAQIFNQAGNEIPLHVKGNEVHRDGNAETDTTVSDSKVVISYVQS